MWLISSLNKRFIFWPMVIVLVGIIVFGVVKIFNKPTAPTDLVTVRRESLTDQILVSGKVKPVQSVDLALEKSGTIRWIGTVVGDYVAAGAALVRLDQSELITQRAKAEADVATQTAELNHATVLLDNQRASVTDVVNDAYTKSNDAVRKQTDELFTDDENTPKLSFTTIDSQTKTDVETLRSVVGESLNRWQTILANQTLADAQSRLTVIRQFLDRLGEALTNAVNLPQATVNIYKTNINTARANVSAALTAVNALQQSMNAQQSTIELQAATLASARATIANINAQLGKANLISPITGVVSRQDAKVGQLAAAGVPLVSIISNGRFEIEANVPELLIGTIQSGNAVDVFFDAFPDKHFSGKITKIDPAETIIDGVVNFKITVALAAPSNRAIKSGLTANLSIVTARKENALVVERAALYERDGQFFAQKVTGTVATETPVTVGLIAHNGLVEIIGGLREGDRLQLNQ